MKGLQPIISPGWSHYFIAAPLSPKARVNLNRVLRSFADQEPSFKALPAHALSLPILDLGVLPEAIEPRLIRVLDAVTHNYASLQVHAGYWVTEEQNHQGYLWLNWGDRLGALKTMRRELERGLQHNCSDLTCVGPNSSNGTQTQKNKDFFSVLCGTINKDKLDTYPNQFRGSAWLNEIFLKKRPQHFEPSTSYQGVWQRTLPLELPLLTESELHEHTHPSHLSSHSKDDRSKMLLEALERNLTEITQTSSPSPTQSKRRRRRPRKNSPTP